MARPALASAEELRSPVNGLAPPPAGEGYSFYAVGHLYGSQANERSAFPAATILANLDVLNGAGAAFVMTLGDNVRRPEERYFENYRRAFSSKLSIPVYDAAGNHDLRSRALYEKFFGRTAYSFVYGTELFIVMDSERMRQDDPALWEDAERALRRARDDDSIRNVFLFTHRLVWTVGEERFRIVYEHLNSQAGYGDLKAFKAKLMPLVEAVAAVKPVYWLSGDIGAAWTLPLFYEKTGSPAVTYLATGLGDAERDVMVRVDVKKKGREISFTPISLAGGVLAPIESYGTAYWREYFVAHQPSWRERARTVSRKVYLLAGAAAGFLSFGALVALKRSVRG